VRQFLVTFDAFTTTFLSIEKVNEEKEQDKKAFSSSSSSSSYLHLKAVQIVPHATSFGGLITAISAIVATAVSLELLLEYAYDLGVETTSMTMSLSPSQPDLIKSFATVTLTASASTGGGGGGGGGGSSNTNSASCVITSIKKSNPNALIGDWTITSRTLLSPNTCVFKLTCPTLLLNAAGSSSSSSSSSSISSLQDVISPSLQISLGKGLQITSWSLTINDARDGAYTQGLVTNIPILAASLPINSSSSSNSPPFLSTQWASSTGLSLVEATSRLHSAKIQLHSSTVLDYTFTRLWLSTPLTYYGLRAIFFGHSIDAASGEWEGAGLIGGDALLLTFIPSTWTYQSTLRPSTSILYFIAGLFALFIGIIALFKVIHDVIDIYFGIAAKERDIDLQLISSLSALNNATKEATNIIGSTSTVNQQQGEEQKQLSKNTSTTTSSVDNNIGSLALSAGISPTLIAAFSSSLSPSKQQQRGIGGGGGGIFVTNVSRFQEPSVRLMPVKSSSSISSSSSITNINTSVSVLSIQQQLQQQQSPLSSTSADHSIDYSVTGLSRLFGFTQQKAAVTMTSPSSPSDGGVNNFKNNSALVMRMPISPSIVPDTINPTFNHPRVVAIGGGVRNTSTINATVSGIGTGSSSSAGTFSRTLPINSLSASTMRKLTTLPETSTSSMSSESLSIGEGKRQSEEDNEDDRKEVD
jgi:hypothetical protein